ncbi:MAG: hypothetical protein JWM41_4069 [Gemmatimonadetes bacterium]|nr:hypothetical protein [Gemmatimonadota bacterium]
MEFVLHYRGPLRANRGPTEKHALRKHFHVQLKKLWTQYPLKSFEQMIGPERIGQNFWLIKPVRDFRFAPLVTEQLQLVAELDILLLRPEPPGSLLNQSGDIDNRIKTLLDALKIPSEPNALPKEAHPVALEEEPLFCLLEDDSLVTHLTIRTDRLLEPVREKSEVVALVRVTTRQLRVMVGTIGLA